MLDIHMLCEAVFEARNKKDDLKRQVDDADRQFREAQAELAAALRDTGSDSVEHGDFVLATKRTVRWKVPPAARQRLVGVLKEYVPELVKETVNVSSLSAYLRKNEDGLESSEPAWWRELKDLLDRAETDDISIRKRRT